MINDLIDRYIQLRDKKAQITRAHETQVAKFDAAMKKVEEALAKHMTENGTERVGSAAGTAFFSSTRSATVADRDAFFDYLQASGNWHLADLRAAKKQISDFRDENNDLPPGINWREERVVRINRA